MLYSESKEDESANFSWQFYGPGLTPIDKDSLQRNLGNIGNRVITIQADYVQPVTENGKLEAGYKSILRNVDNNFIFEDFNNESNFWVLPQYK